MHSEVIDRLYVHLVDSRSTVNAWKCTRTLTMWYLLV